MCHILLTPYARPPSRRQVIKFSDPDVDFRIKNGMMWKEMDALIHSGSILSVQLREEVMSPRHPSPDNVSKDVFFARAAAMHTYAPCTPLITHVTGARLPDAGSLTPLPEAGVLIHLPDAGSLNPLPEAGVLIYLPDAGSLIHLPDAPALMQGKKGGKTVNKMGLLAGHAYTILELREFDLKRMGLDRYRDEWSLRLVKLRNPWGKGDFAGQWGPKSEVGHRHATVFNPTVVVLRLHTRTVLDRHRCTVLD